MPSASATLVAPCPCAFVYVLVGGARELTDRETVPTYSRYGRALALSEDVPGQAADRLVVVGTF
jgi:hypothetical protein